MRGFSLRKPARQPKGADIAPVSPQVEKPAPRPTLAFAPKVQAAVREAGIGAGKGVWILTDGPDWKNDILIKYQKGLIDKGITNTDHLKILAQQMYQESGVNVLPHGDAGCSFGILQYNVCAKFNWSVRTFLSRKPEWKDVDTQLDYWITTIGGIYNDFDGDIRLAVVFHNNPRAARNRESHKACGGVDSYRIVGSGKTRRWSCYFDDEVMDPDHAAAFSFLLL